jgi:hypothetical protein
MSLTSLFNELNPSFKVEQESDLSASTLKKTFFSLKTNK